MLAYRHLFHAGNFADVFKHALLAQLAGALRKKDSPFLYVDSHAGIGRYDLSHPWAQKNREHETGINLIWGRSDTPAEMSAYLNAVRAENPGGILRYYPGSPCLVRGLLRPQDRMALAELNKKDHVALSTLFARDQQVMVRLMDGYQALKAWLPPPERRGLIFIDSSFDRAQEFARLTEALALAHRKFATGIYAIWYPLMDAVTMRAFERDLMATNIRKMLKLEIAVHPREWTLSLRGCGLLVVNPPFGFLEAAAKLLKWLSPALMPEPQKMSRTAGGPAAYHYGAAGYDISWLVPE